jgi:predicted transcriptional regulator of viral defense system
MTKQTQIGMDLLKILAQEGDRIFSTERASILSKQLDIKPSYLNEMLFLLKQNHWIHPIKKGLYCLDSTMLVGGPIHEYEIGTALAVPSMISHFSALHYHHLTDQIPQIIYVSTSKRLGNVGSLKEVNGIKYNLTHMKPEYFFGSISVWMGEARVPISDLERTLVDGLRNPQFCGGFSEVLAAYQLAQDRINLTKLMDYAQRLETATLKRLGWVLEHIGIPEKKIATLEKITIKGFRKLDANGEDFGPYNKKWKIRENL